MKNYYDKVLFILGLVLLGLGVAFFFIKGGLPTGAPPPIVNQAPGGGAYPAVPISNLSTAEASWEAAPDEYPADGKEAWDKVVNANLAPDQKPQQYPEPDLWYYGVFTPPKIWWDPVAGWTALSPKGAKPAPPPFGLHLDNLVSRLYRIQFRGYLGSTDRTATLQLEDTTSKTYFNTKVGLEKADKGIKVTDFKVERRTGPGGSIYRVGMITMLDEHTGQTLTLEDDKPLSLPNDRYFQLETEAPLDVKTWEVTKAGETLDVGDVNFKISKVDYDAPSVTVQKTQPKQDMQELILTPTTPSTPAPTTGDGNTTSTATPAAAPATPAPM
jgi:hypothetical protein